MRGTNQSIVLISHTLVKVVYCNNMVQSVQWLHRCTEPSANVYCTHTGPHLTAEV